jgi:hypothetical protein
MNYYRIPERDSAMILAGIQGGRPDQNNWFA